MGGFDYKVSQDSCHCRISLNWKMRIYYYKVQVKSFQMEGLQNFKAQINYSLILSY